jgi:hypothetical protein
MRQGEKIHPLQEKHNFWAISNRERGEHHNFGDSLFVLRDAVVLLGILPVADQLGEALVMGDDDELEVLLRLPVLHDPGETTRAGQNRRQQPAVGIKEPEQVFVLTACPSYRLLARQQYRNMPWLRTFQLEREIERRGDEETG